MRNIFWLLLIPFYLFGLNIDFESFSADFSQTVTNEHNKKITYSGSLSVKKPDKALWNYKKPVKKELYINESQIIVYEPELMQAVYMHKKSMPSINEMLKSAVDLGGGKYKTRSADKDITFELTGSLPQNISYIDDMGNSVKIVFSNQKKNPPLTNANFEFNAPSGIDIIRR